MGTKAFVTFPHPPTHIYHRKRRNKSVRCSCVLEKVLCVLPSSSGLSCESRNDRSHRIGGSGEMAIFVAFPGKQHDSQIAKKGVSRKRFKSHKSKNVVRRAGPLG